MLCTQLPGDFMDRAVRDDANRWHGQLSTFLFSAEPLTALMRSRVGQLLALVIVVPWIALRVRGISELRDKGFFFPNEGNLHVILEPQEFQLGLSCGSEARLELLSGFLPPIALILATLAAMAKRVTWVRQIFILFGFLDAIVNLIVFTRLVRNERYQKTISGTPAFLFLLDLVLFPCPMLFCELCVIELCMLSNFIYLCAAAPWFVPYDSIIALALLCSALLFRMLLIRRGERLIEEDRSVFTREWEAIMSRDPETLRLLQDRVREHEAAVSAHVEEVGEDAQEVVNVSCSCRTQRVYKLVAGLSHENGAQSIQQRSALGVVGSLDQLYAIAVLVEPCFRRKAHKLAEGANGMLALPVAADGGMEYVRLQEAQEDARARKQLESAGLKTASRAIEKILSLCQGDTSRLLDVVRQCIVFERLQDLCDCLDRILEDPELVVMRIKNRLDPSYNSRTTGGYRDVVMNVRVVTERTRELGVAGHICELRLSIVGLHRLCTPERRLRYRKLKHMLRDQGVWQRLTSRRSKAELVMKTSVSSIQESIDRVSARLLEKDKLMGSDVQEEGQQQDGCFLDWTLKLRGRYPGGIMDEKLRSVVTGIQTSMTSSVIFSSSPVTNALHKTTFRLALIFTGILLTYMYSSTHNMRPIMSNNSSVVHVARLEILQYRDQVPRTSVPQASVSNFTLVLNSCAELSPSSSKALNDSLYFFFSPPVEANGWRSSLSRQTQGKGLDPVAFHLFVLDQPASGGVALPAERWKKWTDFSCEATPSESICDQGKQSTGARISFNVEVRMDRYFYHFFAFYQPFACFSSVLASRLGHYKTSKFFFASLFHVVGAWEFYLAAAKAKTVQRLIYQLIWAISDSSFGLVIQLAEQYMMRLLPIYSFLTSVGGSAALTNFFQSSVTVIDMGYSNFILMTVWLYFIIGRRVHLLHASRNIKAERQQYDELWSKLSASEDTQRLLDRIKNASKLHSTESIAQRRLNDSADSPRATSDLLDWVMKGSHEHSFSNIVPSKTMWQESEEPRVTSLDQLYMQAVFIHPIFLKKVQDLAATSRGLFPSNSQEGSDPVEYVAWEDAMGDENLKQRVRWAHVKTLERSIQKLVRSYNSEVPRLLDVVRQCIVFERLQDLCDCLDRILEDPELVVMRIKNRLDPSYNSRTTGGYRDVVMNVRVVTERTRELGVAGHICELQMITREFMDKRTVEGHKLYVAFRNLRCE
ncbi:hypothetical protein GUITHDRAFT_104927 [Guillardia theta CCMP2712]|uniref:Uncharacterized protein n=1 Tax=Guillardia theta (strain CCMP2712) TaxID=905079 RepID=L1JMV0_GUITC|nr:hypothetical protein GUITHDRAFT_104927 [Guillardia theta CCMP2712]EKX49398.1 hypothetical protein GUITHDRAFT_104927 [Guillardia theta CCMP2712]|eukprot:XP_005836378.1 hypothetical protein GUITHDRAFT_104927 [Guillardia theta CCMP2712]